ncbi:MAG: nucleotide exchange factor GrpE [Bacteroidales bacterium]|nr:nucleotide exchange factor GrpE [Bacteroidales bacterium]MDY3912385.1 nucleotide exchange factor GrpE [Sodaliphilus sp.]
MSKEKDKKQKEAESKQAAEQAAKAAETETTQQAEADGKNPKEETADEKVERLKKELEQAKKEYLFLMAEFDNFRKRTLKEKQDLVKYGCQEAMRNLLPVVDDFERAIDSISKADDLDSAKEGINLIYNKFIKYLESNNVKAIDSTGKDFDTDYHEAITTFPASDEKMKGKVIDTTLKGYMINDKVLRHAKVVVGK